MSGSPSDATRRNTDLSILHPVVRTAVTAVLEELQQHSIPLFVFEAFRSPERQAFLYDQGRGSPGRIVTYADAWRSYHQYGLAVDFVFGGPGKWTWKEPKKGMWNKLHEIGAKHGLMRLEFETPHLQLAGTSSNALLKGVYPSGGDKAWSSNLRAAIAAWQAEPDAPPPPKPDGTVANKSVTTLSLMARESTSSVEDSVIELVAASSIATYEWKQRGPAPKGYVKGLALVYADVYSRFKAGDAVAVFMARKASGDADSDALSWYEEQFKAIGMKNDVSGANTLRHLFVLLMGLGMRESSGRYCEGRDRSANNTTAEKAEAGLFQTSYNLVGEHPLLAELMTRYSADPGKSSEVFKEGVICKASDWQNYGQGPGAEFQKLSKLAPAFATEIAGVGLRCLRKHWGPINRRAAELKTDCDQLLKDVQAIVDAS